MKQYGMIEVYLDVEALTNKITINKTKEITIDENDVLRIFSIYANKQLLNKVEDIIKVNLPSCDVDAKRVLNEGIEVEGEKYVFLATTTGAMKEQDMDLDLSGQCYFVNAKYESFVIELKRILSLGKINEKYNTELCINKDIVSRISLAFSAGERVYIPGIKKAILPETTYTYVNNYLQFAENKEGKIDLENLLKELPEVDRILIYMKYYLGYTLEEISNVMSIPEGTVKSKIYNNLKKMKKRLEVREV